MAVAIGVYGDKLALVVDVPDHGIEAAAEWYIDRAEPARVIEKTVGSPARKIIPNDLPGVVDAKGHRSIGCGGYIEGLKSATVRNEPVLVKGRIQVITYDLSCNVYAGSCGNNFLQGIDR